MVVEEIMTADPKTLRSTSSIRNAVSILFELDVRHLPIVDGKELVGIVSDRDLRECLVPATGPSLSKPVSSIMQTDVISVTPETEVSEAVDLMVEQKVGALPVVRPGSQELVGILSYVDVLRVARDNL